YPGDGLEPGILAVAEQPVGLGQVAQRVGDGPVEVAIDIAARLRPDQQGQADGDGTGCKGHDDGLQAAIDYDQAAEETEGGARHEGDEHAPDDLPGLAVHQLAG